MNAFPKLGDPAPHRVVILRALQLGDLLCAVPAFRALRAALPEAVISLVGLPWAREFVQRFDYYLDDFIEFPGYPGFPERPVEVRQVPEFLNELQWLEFDLGLQMQGSGGISNSLVQLFGARNTGGFYLPGQYCPDPQRYLEYPVHESEIWRHLRLMEFLGVPLQGDDLEFPLYAKDWQELHALEQQYGFRPGAYAVIHPGSRGLARRWPLERFAAVADGLHARGLQVLLTGTKEEAHLTTEVAQRMTAPSINLAGKTGLGGVGALLAGARLLVSNDTGVSHLAAALRTPSVILFTASDPNRWAPKDSNLHRSISWATAVEAAEVLLEADGLLGMERAYAVR